MIPRILIADKQKEATELFTRILEEDGAVTCYTAEDVPSLLSQLEQTTFAVILLDVQMVFAKGFYLLKTIMGLCPDAVVLIMGYLKELDVMKRAMAVGAAGYMLKPMAARELRRAVKGHIDHFPITVAGAGLPVDGECPPLLYL